MNAGHIKLALALLWLVPGTGLLINDLTTGRTLGFVVFGRTVAFAWVFLAFGVLNLARWILARSHRGAVDEWQAQRRRPRSTATRPPPDSNFDFSDGPPPGR